MRDSPYVGLVPYSEADARFFFGREEESEIIAANLRTSRLTLLYGPTGVGKTSVLLAGVLPHLREFAKDKIDGKPSFAVAVFRSWRSDPLAGLGDGIRSAVAGAVDRRGVARWSSTTPFASAVRTWTNRVHRLLVVLDQFEDYFLYHPDEEGKKTFAGEFPRLVNDPSLRLHFLLSIREDALAQLDQFEGRIPNLFTNYLRVDHLDADAARRAIERPIEEYNGQLQREASEYSVEPELVEAVLDQVQTRRVVLGQAEPAAATFNDQPRIETAFLQLVMARLWTATVAADSHALRKQTLVDLGGAAHIVKAYLHDTMAKLEPSEQDLAANLFRFLVTPSNTKIAHRAADLAFWVSRPKGEVESLLEKLSRAEEGRIGRILRPLPSPDGDTETYEIFHDVLAEPVLEWRSQYELRAQVKAEQAARQKARRSKLLRWLGVALLIIVSGIAIMWELHSRAAAADQRNASRSRELAALATTQVSVDPAAAVQLAAEATRVHATAQAEDALRAALAESHVRAILRGHEGAVLAAGFSPNGKRIVTGGLDGTTQIWSAASGRRVAVLPRRGNGNVRAAVFSRDGARVITASTDGQTRIWDVASRRILSVLRGHDGAAVFTTALSRDGKRIVTGSNDGTARVWDVASGRSLAVLRGHKRSVLAAGFNPNGKLVVTGSDDGTARIWDVANGRSLAVLRGHTGSVTTAAFSPDGLRILTAGRDGTTRLWSASVKSPRVVMLLSGQTGPIHAAGFSRGGDRVVIATGLGTAFIWDVSNGSTLLPFRGHSAEVLGVAFSPDGKAIVTASADGTARVWEVPGTQDIATLRGHRGGVIAAAFTSDSTHVITVGADGTRRVWDASTGELAGVVGSGSGGSIFAADFTPDAERVVIAGADGRARVFEAASERSLAVLPGQTSQISAVAFSPDGTRIATGRTDGKALIYDASNGKRVSLLRGDSDSVSAITFSPDGDYVVTAQADTARVFETSTGRKIKTLGGHTKSTQVLAAGFSPKQQIVVSTGTDETAVVFDASNWQQLAVLRGHIGAVRAIAFSPAGEVAVTAGTDRTARVWTLSGQLLAVLRGHTAEVLGAAFSPDGKRIATASFDGTARIYSCPLCGSLKDLQALAARSVGAR
jgi:WD40 repeat protein